MLYFFIIKFNIRIYWFHNVGFNRKIYGKLLLYFRGKCKIRIMRK